MSHFLKHQSLKSLLLLGSFALAACSGMASKPAKQANQDWPSFGRDYSNQRLSPLTQINPKNDQKAQLISFAKKLIFCALTSYDVRLRSRTNKEQSNNTETPTIATALHAVNRMPNSSPRPPLRRAALCPNSRRTLRSRARTCARD